MRQEKNIAYAHGDTPVTFPGNNITGDVTAFLIVLTNSSSSIWSTAVDPPTRIAFAPHFSTRAAISAASFGELFSESRSPTQIVPCDLMKSLSFVSVCLRSGYTSLSRVEPINKLVVNVNWFFSLVRNFLTSAATPARNYRSLIFRL